MMKKIKFLLPILLISLLFSGCEEISGDIEEMKGNITGNTYTCKFYSNAGENYMIANGKNINMESNIVKEQTYDPEDGWGYVETLSAVVNINIDGQQIVNCGSTCIFVEDGLKEEVDFTQESINIMSESDSITDITMISGIVNQFKNSFGHSKVVVIQSQLGTPLCAFSGDSVNWKIASDLPKTTRLSIDGKLLYIHRANFQIIDKSLLNTVG